MQVGGGGGMRSEINVTPLVDVVLVLLIIFMVLTPIIQMGYAVRVPPKAPPGLAADVFSDQIVLRLSADKKMFINKEELADEQALRNRMREILKGNTGKPIFFAGSGELLYDDVLLFLDRTRQGITDPKSGAVNPIAIIIEDPQLAPAAAPAAPAAPTPAM